MREIDGRTRTCGLLGCPVEHTLSPVIHTALSEITGINLAYLPFRVEKEALGDAVQGAHALNILGLNVTVPHKERVLPFLDGIDPLAERIGAVNTLVRTERGYRGYNTDMPGLYRAMVSDGVQVDKESVIILGAGGVARAVAFMLADRAEKIVLLNRTVEKAAAIAQEVNAFTGRETTSAMPISDYGKLAGGGYIAIQATNVGMYPDMDSVVISDKAFYEKVKIGYDLIFNPADTLFMRKVREAGGLSYNGLKMLLYQGIIAYELWNNVKITEEQALWVYDRLKERI